LKKADAQKLSLAEAAALLVKESAKEYESLGVSDLMLNDPAAKRMIARAEKLGVAGKYIAFMKAIVQAAQQQSPEPLDIDMLGATGATMMDLGFSAEATWAILAVTRALAAGAHYIEEIERHPYMRLGESLTPKEDYDGPPDRPVPPSRTGPRSPNQASANRSMNGAGLRGTQEARRKRLRHRGRDRGPEQKVGDQKGRQTVKSGA